MARHAMAPDFLCCCSMRQHPPNSLIFENGGKNRTSFFPFDLFSRSVGRPLCMSQYPPLRSLSLSPSSHRPPALPSTPKKKKRNQHFCLSSSPISCRGGITVANNRSCSSHHSRMTSPPPPSSLDDVYLFTLETSAFACSRQRETAKCPIPSPPPSASTPISNFDRVNGGGRR